MKEFFTNVFIGIAGIAFIFFIAFLIFGPAYFAKAFENNYFLFGYTPELLCMLYALGRGIKEMF